MGRLFTEIHKEDDINVIMAPDGKPLEFPRQVGLPEQITGVISGEAYPIPFMGLYEPDIIIDIGAHVGSAARYFKHQFPKARVISYEPHPLSFEFLKKNMKGIKGFEAHQVGLADKKGKTKLYYGRDNFMQASMVMNEENLSGSIDVEVVDAAQAIEQLKLKEPVDILKIDTEGMETPILKSLQDNVLKTVDVVYLEYHSDSDRRHFDQLLGERMVLFHSYSYEPHRGIVCYVADEIIKYMYQHHNVLHYTNAKHVKLS